MVRSSACFLGIGAVISSGILQDVSSVMIFSLGGLSRLHTPLEFVSLPISGLAQVAVLDASVQVGVWWLYFLPFDCSVTAHRYRGHRLADCCFSAAGIVWLTSLGRVPSLGSPLLSPRPSLRAQITAMFQLPLLLFACTGAPHMVDCSLLPSCPCCFRLVLFPGKWLLVFVALDLLIGI